jgi:aryl-alcohol dehydrogenase-like predicted oxidoreductase
MGRPGVTSAIVGAKRPSQVEENLGAVGAQLDDKEIEAVEKIFQEELGSLSENV